MEEVTEEFSLQPEIIPEKIPFWQNPKIPIVVALVTVGLITLLLAGWLVWSSQLLDGILVSKYCEKDGDCTFTQCCGCASKCHKICSEKPFALPCECENNQCVVKQSQQVTITTDKTAYEQGETVKIIVKNNSEGAVYLGSCDAYYPEIEKNGTWGRTFLIECETLSIKDEISREESKILQECETGSKEGPLLPWKFYPGNWRITLGYYLGCVDKEPSHCLSHKTIYSNEFTIKEKKLEEECYQDPKEALDKFLSYLHSGEYEKAAGLYGDNFPSYYRGVNIQNKTEFLRVHCEFVGACIEYEIIDGERLSTDSYIFGVKFFFYSPKGERILFELPETYHPPGEKVDKYVSKFGFRVKKIGQCYRVLDVPPQDVP